MTTDFPTAPLAPGLRGAGGGAVEKSLPASHTEILTLPLGPVELALSLCVNVIPLHFAVPPFQA